MDESDETSDWSDWTVVQPGMSGRSEAVRCEVQRASWSEFVLARSKGMRSSHRVTSVGLCVTQIAVARRVGVRVGLSETVICLVLEVRRS